MIDPVKVEQDLPLFQKYSRKNLPERNHTSPRDTHVNEDLYKLIELKLIP